jgi:hypothetical protein
MCLSKQFISSAFAIYFAPIFLFFAISENRPSYTADSKILDDQKPKPTSIIFFDVTYIELVDYYYYKTVNHLKY